MERFLVGSTASLNRRLSHYLSVKYLERQMLRSKSVIYKAILKDGHSNFSFNILKYCDINELTKWEQYYIDKLKPEYTMC